MELQAAPPLRCWQQCYRRLQEGDGPGAARLKGGGGREGGGGRADRSGAPTCVHMMAPVPVTLPDICSPPPDPDPALLLLLLLLPLVPLAVLGGGAPGRGRAKSSARCCCGGEAAPEVAWRCRAASCSLNSSRTRRFRAAMSSLAAAREGGGGSRPQHTWGAGKKEIFVVLHSAVSSPPACEGRVWVLGWGCIPLVELPLCKACARRVQQGDDGLSSAPAAAARTCCCCCCCECMLAGANCVAEGDGDLLEALEGLGVCMGAACGVPLLLIQLLQEAHKGPGCCHGSKACTSPCCHLGPRSWWGRTRGALRVIFCCRAGAGGVAAAAA
jgi:hypothetical protein